MQPTSELASMQRWTSNLHTSLLTDTSEAAEGPEDEARPRQAFAISSARWPKASLRATKSVSQLTSTMAARVGALCASAMRPCDTARSASLNAALLWGLCVVVVYAVGEISGGEYGVDGGGDHQMQELRIGGRRNKRGAGLLILVDPGHGGLDVVARLKQSPLEVQDERRGVSGRGAAPVQLRDETSSGQWAGLAAVPPARLAENPDTYLRQSMMLRPVRWRSSLTCLAEAVALLASRSCRSSSALGWAMCTCRKAGGVIHGAGGFRRRPCGAGVANIGAGVAAIDQPAENIISSVGGGHAPLQAETQKKTKVTNGLVGWTVSQP